MIKNLIASYVISQEIDLLFWGGFLLFKNLMTFNIMVHFRQLF